MFELNKKTDNFHTSSNKIIAFLEDIIEEKIRNRDANCLSKVIDYACGSGHFLTEVMDRIQKQN